jgi:predicted dehydrogenase
MSKLKIGIVGCGEVSHFHARYWRKIPQVQLVAACDVNEKSAYQLAKQWGIPHTYTELSALLGQEDISLVDICTPPHTHLPLAIQAMERGSHVLLEKPMAMTAKEAYEMVQCKKAKGVKLSVVHNTLFDSTILKACSMVDRGELGEIVCMENIGISTKDEPMLANSSHWCHALPGGRIGETIIHDIYILQHFLGRLEVRDVEAVKVGNYPWVPSDGIIALFKSDKRLGTIHISYSGPRAIATRTIYGSKGILRIEYPAETVVKLPPIDYKSTSNYFGIAADVIRQNYQMLSSLVSNAARVITGRWLFPHEAFFRSFIDSLLKGKEPPVSAEDAYEATRVLEEVCQRISVAESERHK